MVPEHLSTRNGPSFPKRGLSYAEAIHYVGVKRRTFDLKWRPRLVALNQGTCVIFDREELDRLFEQFKLESEGEGISPCLVSATRQERAQNRPWNGRPIVTKGVQKWAEKQGAFTPERTELGKSTAGGRAPDFASVASSVLKKRNSG
jgi:hypothetical protein